MNEGDPQIEAQEETPRRRSESAAKLDGAQH